MDSVYIVFDGWHHLQGVGGEGKRSSSNDEGSGIPKRTFEEYKKAIADTFDINICCDASDGYKYRIEDVDGLLKDPVKNWLLSSFAVSNTIQESRKLKGRILFERIPSGNDYLMGIVAAMREEKRIRISYQSFHRDQPQTVLLEPYCVKVFKQRWYVLARNCEKDVMRTYALDRVLRLEQTDEAFTLPDTFDAEVEVLAPAWVREEFRLMAEELHRMYDGA